MTLKAVWYAPGYTYGKTVKQVSDLLLHAKEAGATTLELKFTCPEIVRLEAMIERRGRAIELIMNWIEDAGDFSAANLSRMEHYFDSECIPTMDELNQCVKYDGQLRIMCARLKNILKEGRDE